MHSSPSLKHQTKSVSHAVANKEIFLKSNALVKKLSTAVLYKACNKFSLYTNPFHIVLIVFISGAGDHRVEPVEESRGRKY